MKQIDWMRRRAFTLSVCSLGKIESCFPMMIHQQLSRNLLSFSVPPVLSENHNAFL